MKAGQAPLRTFGDLKQFFDIQTGADDSVDKKDSKKKKPKKELQETDSVEPANHSVAQNSLDEPRSEDTTPKGSTPEDTTPEDSEGTSAGAESTAKSSSLQNSNISEESEETLSPQLRDTTDPTLGQQPGKKCFKRYATVVTAHLSFTKRYAAFGEVVGRKFNFDFISWDDPNKILSHFAGYVGIDDMPTFDLHPESGVCQCLCHNAFNFECLFFFRHGNPMENE